MTVTARHGYDVSHYAQEPADYRPQWQPPAPPPPKRQRRWDMFIAGVVVGAVLLGGSYLAARAVRGTDTPAAIKTAVSEVSSASNAISVHGTMELDSSSGVVTSGSSCYGSGGFSDIAAGAQVVISDDSGATLTITHLDSGSGGLGHCIFSFEATIPKGKGFYGVTVTHRGTVKFPESQIGAPTVSLGS